MVRALAPRRAGCGRSIPHARGAARDVVIPCHIGGRCTGERPVFFDARPWSEVTGAASNAKQLRVSNKRGLACDHCLWKEGSARELCSRLPRAALDVVISHPTGGRKRCCVLEWTTQRHNTQRRRRRSMGYGRTGRRPGNGVAAFLLPCKRGSHRRTAVVTRSRLRLAL